MSILDLSYCELLSDSSQVSGGVLSQTELTTWWSQVLGIPAEEVKLEKLGEWSSINGYGRTYKLSSSSSDTAFAGLFSVTALSS